MPSGEKREQRSFDKYVGWFEAKVLAFNPDREALEKLLGNAVDNDPEYLKQTDEGENKLNMVVWLEDVRKGVKFPLRFSLINKEVVGKASGKFQYINQTGDTGWVDSPENLQEWFTNFQDKNKNNIAKKEFRKAIAGEGQLYSFLKAWLQIDWYKPTANIFLDSKKLMKGNVSELNSLINSDLTTIKGGEPSTTIQIACIRTKEEDDGKLTEYQQVYNGAFLPGFYAKALRVGGPRGKAVEKFIENVTDKEHGCQEYFIMQEMAIYDPTKNIAASSKVMEPTEADDPKY